MYFVPLVIALFIYQIGAQTQSDKEICVRSEIKTKRSDVSSAFHRLIDAIISFFKITVTKLERRRVKIKKAFNTFVKEAFTDSKPTCSLRYSLKEDIQSEMSVPELIIHHGYQVETHTALTEDGYMLSLHRILPTRTNYRQNASINQKAVIITHGLLGSSIDWILLGPKKSLPYMLLDAGYDVWLPNFRGNKYSKAHVTKFADTADFWNFTWHEMGLLDIPTIIDYVREITKGRSEIHFIAYSMSGSALLVLLSSSLRYNALLKSAYLIAPLAYMDHVRGPLQYLSEFYTQYIRHNLFENSESKNEFRLEGLFNILETKQFCKDKESLCTNPLLFLVNGDGQISNISPRIRIHNIVPSGGSAKTIIHYLQLIKSGLFQMFDMGESMNNMRYGTATPPLYQLNEIKLPVILLNSVNDSLANVLDISKLMLDMPGVKNYVVNSVNFSHLDFMWSESAPELVYLPLIKELEKI